MTTLQQITGVANNIKRYEKVHGSNPNTTAALKHLRAAYGYIKQNGGK